jgi:hypothetical protein
MYLDGSDNIAVSNDIITGAALGATALQPASTNNLTTFAQATQVAQNVVAPYTNHQSRTDNPHATTLQQVVDAGNTATGIGAITVTNWVKVSDGFDKAELFKDQLVFSSPQPTYISKTGLVYRLGSANFIRWPTAGAPTTFATLLDFAPYTNQVTPEAIAAAGGLTNAAAFQPAFTNSTTGWFDGVLNGSNGVFVTRNGTNRWIIW